MDRPGTGSLNPVAIEAAAEATKLSELSMYGVARRLGGRSDIEIHHGDFLLSLWENLELRATHSAAHVEIYCVRYRRDILNLMIRRLVLCFFANCRSRLHPPIHNSNGGSPSQR